MVLHCCHDDFFNRGLPRTDPYRPKACREVRRLLETEAEPVVMENLITPNVRTDQPHCYAHFPSPIVLRLCRTGCRAWLRVQLAMMLKSLDPSPEIVAALVHQLEVPDDTSLVPHPLALRSEKNIDDAVARALADAGELDLGPVLAALASPSPRVRRGATLAVFLAMELKGPLDMPGLLPALEKLLADPDPETATMAGWAVRSYRLWAKESPDEHVSWLINEQNNKHLAIRMLAVRRFSCLAKTAADALARLSTDPDPGIAAPARRAIAFRAERCRRFGL